jgi:hypothetical protein
MKSARIAIEPKALGFIVVVIEQAKPDRLCHPRPDSETEPVVLAYCPLSG